MKLTRLLCCALVLSLCLFPVRARTEKSPQQSPVNDEWNKPFKPFRIVGNVYYVGTNNLACYLITTPAGYILMDTGMEQSVPIVRANIEALGYKLRYVRMILSGHAHYDHVAGHAAMKEATGAQILASAEDALVLESGGKKDFHFLGGFKPVKVDRIIKDGEPVRLGNVVLTPHLTPGHTKGNTTWTMVTEENGRKYNVVFTGSMSINPGVRMINNPTWPGISEAYAKSFQKLKTLPCDIFLGTHAPFFEMEEKARRIGQGGANPFIDPEGYRNYVASFEKKYLDQVQSER